MEIWKRGKIKRQLWLLRILYIDRDLSIDLIADLLNHKESTVIRMIRNAGFHREKDINGHEPRKRYKIRMCANERRANQNLL